MAYVLTPDAAEDLEAAWRFSFERWGADQADAYLAQVETCIARISTGEAYCRTHRELDARLKSHHCEHHYIFFLEGADKITVIAVLYERMDLLVRMRHRLR